MLEAIQHILIDANDAAKVAQFWSKATGLDIENNYGQFITLKKKPDFPTIAVYQVPEQKASKNRLHLDFKVTDAAVESKRLIELGGGELSQQQNGDFYWRVMCDPEGNEFCISEQW